MATSLVFSFPLFLAYEIGLLFTPAGNGVDFVTGWIWSAVGGRPRVYLCVQGGLAIVFLAAVLYMQRTRRLRVEQFLPTLFEAAIYALTLFTLIIFVMERFLGFDGGLAVSSGAGHALVTSLGAGVHEELVFRLGLMGGLAYLLRSAGVAHPIAVGLALVTSSAAFSFAHHLGPLGDPWNPAVFTYRALAGAMFGAIFYFRSLAHAVYAHFLYDVYALAVR